MVIKKKATSKQPTKKKGKKMFEKHHEDDKPKDQPQTQKEGTTPPAKGQPIKAPVDPLQGIEEREAAAQEPTQKVAKGEVKAPVAKPTKFEEKTPAEMTGPEQEEIMVSGGVTPKEQHDKEQKEQAKLAGEQPK